MIKTYIYGTPLGFNSYEGDESYDNYLKGFYISSRRGKRMMVNRRAGGLTTYNFLVYNLVESEGRPNSFFGMTIQIDNNQYCADFQKIYEWFDYVFEKIQNEKRIFRKDSTGNVLNPLKYAVAKFKDCPQDVHWIKSVLPNIFSPASGLVLKEYDSSFLNEKTGQVVALNPQESNDIVLTAFRRYDWVSISPDNPLLAENNRIDDAISELDYNDLQNKLNEFNEVLVPMAIDRSKCSIEVLEALKNNTSQSIASLIRYIPRLAGEEERGIKFQDQLQKYKDLLANIETLLDRISKDSMTEIEDKQKTQYCYSCKQHKSTDLFDSPNSTQCKECDAKGTSEGSSKTDVTSYKKCRQCGSVKSDIYFSDGSGICSTCQKKNNLDRIKPVIFAGVLSILVFVVVLVLINRPKSDDVVPDTPSGQTTAVTNNNVDKTKFEKAVLELDIVSAYACLTDKEDGSSYYNQLKSAIDAYLWKIIDESTLDIDLIQQEIIQSALANKSIYNDVSYDFNQDYWLNLAKDYVDLNKLLKLPELTNEQKTRGVNIINNNPDRFGEDYMSLLDAKKIKKDRVIPTSPENNSVKVEILDSDKTTVIKTLFYSNQKAGFDVYKGQWVRITSPTRPRYESDGPFTHTRPEYDHVLMIEAGRVGSNIYNCAGSQITITAKMKSL